jgi:hypothetical protein
MPLGEGLEPAQSPLQVSDPLRVNPVQQAAGKHPQPVLILNDFLVEVGHNLPALARGNVLPDVRGMNRALDALGEGLEKARVDLGVEPGELAAFSRHEVRKHSLPHLSVTGPRFLHPTLAGERVRVRVHDRGSVREKPSSQELLDLVRDFRDVYLDLDVSLG